MINYFLKCKVLRWYTEKNILLFILYEHQKKCWGPGVAGKKEPNRSSFPDSCIIIKSKKMSNTASPNNKALTF